MITTLTLNPALDTTLYVPKLVPDDSNRVKHVEKDPGGKGLNVSRVLFKLGKRVSTITVFGGHTGNEVEDLLKKEGIYPFTIHLSEDTRNNITITQTEPFSQTRFNQSGPAMSAEEYKSMLSLIEQLGDNANIFVVSGSLPRNMKQDAYKEIILLLKEVNPKIKVILDADSDQLRYGLEAGPYMVKPNLHEAARLLNRKIETLDDQKQALMDICAMGAEVAVISRGSKGIIGYNREQFIEVDSIPVEVKSTVGAGDALVAGICFALEDGKSFKEVLEFGVLVSTAKVITSGTGTCSWDEINQINQIAKSRVI